jgi:nucleotide-binding universal stress UspA family protein
VASSLAAALGAGIEAVHVSERVGRTARTSATRLGIPFSTVAGDPLERLVELAAAPDVLGVAAGVRSHPTGRRPAGHLALGLADQLAKPVVAVPPSHRPPARLERVLVAMGGKPGKAEYLKPAVQLATATGLELVVVHVDDEDSFPSFSDAAAHETEGYAREFMMRNCPWAPGASLELRLGVPADEILAVAEKVSAQLLAVGWPQNQDPARGSVARDLLQRSPIPVLLVGVP